jgi:hypothetical protein
MYVICNYDWWWRYPRTFNDFHTAYMKYELLNDETNIIEHHTKDGCEVVWNKDMINQYN